MDINILKNRYFTKNTVTLKSEAGVEGDIVLPESCSDIEKIIKCSLSPRTSSKSLEGERLEIRGTAFLRLNYLSSDCKICSFETQIPFSKSVTIGSFENPVISVLAQCDYINCRAISPRRFEIRSALNLTIILSTKTPFEIIGDIEGAECRKIEIPSVTPVSEYCDTFTVTDDYTLPAPIKTLTKMSAGAKVLESKIISNKALVKGAISVDISYLDENDSAQNERIDIPISQVLILEGAEEDDELSISLNILRVNVEPSGNNGEVTLEANIEICAEAKREELIPAVTDAYLTLCESKLENCKVTVCSLEKNLSRDSTQTVSLESLGLGVSEIFADIKKASPRITDSGEVIMDLEAIITVLINNGDEILTREISAPLSISVGADPSFVGAEVSGYVTLNSAVFIRGKNTAELKLTAYCTVKNSASYTVICSFEPQQEMMHKKCDDRAVIIFFGEKGEDVWDIAKRYNTSADAVLKQNSLTNSVLDENKKLIIPIV